MKPPNQADIAWRKSSRSSGGANNCVELGTADGDYWYAIRDSKNPDGPTLSTGHDIARTFVSAVKGGRFDS